ncbi:cellulose biosynthesis protein BcsQ [Pseudomonas gingeri]|uniref:Cellulose synthase operon protein YhjQ n=1 Tax=Pseudomonas gingeri TaxID=117681 RepID=A0A7Y8BQZ0_9PSED|nr:cellulose biosynthesis protein BcsQ [Pseudomonas gingeri]NWB84663.1 cellulose synthase operon protein YhjQ [Pseudomonas gingeri]
MHRSDDIANLFNRFGGSVESYREIEPSYDYIEDTAPVVSEVPMPESLTASLDPQPTEPLDVFPSSSMALVGSTPLSRLLVEIEQQRGGVSTAQPVGQGAPKLKAKVIVLVSAKGGVGKSTLAAVLACGIKRSGGRTLALDLDPQNALCLHLGGNEDWPGIAQSESADEDWQPLIRKGFSGSRCLAYGVVGEPQRRSLEQRLENDRLWLARHLAQLDLDEQDTLLIDTPPGATVYLAQALEIADVVLGVTLADAAAYTSLNQLDRLLAPYLQRENPAQYKVVINQLDTSRQFSLDLCEVLKKRTGQQLLGVIRQDHFISEALAYDRNPLAHTPSTRGCQDVLDLSGSLCELLMYGTQESSLS